MLRAEPETGYKSTPVRAVATRASDREMRPLISLTPPSKSIILEVVDW